MSQTKRFIAILLGTRPRTCSSKGWENEDVPCGMYA